MLKLTPASWKWCMHEYLYELNSISFLESISKRINKYRYNQNRFLIRKKWCNMKSKKLQRNNVGCNRWKFKIDLQITNKTPPPLFAEKKLSSPMNIWTSNVIEHWMLNIMFLLVPAFCISLYSNIRRTCMAMLISKLKGQTCSGD